MGFGSEPRGDAEVNERHRRLSRPWQIVSLSLAAAAIGLFLLFVLDMPFLAGDVIWEVEYIAVILALLLPLIFLNMPATRGTRDRVPWYDVLLMLLSAAGVMSVAVTARQAVYSPWAIVPPTPLLVASLVTCIMLIEASRRTAGPAFTFLVAFFTFYPLFCNHMPGLLAAPAYGFGRTFGFHLLGGESIMGIPTKVMASLLIPLLVMAAVIQLGGTGSFILNTALAVVGGLRGGAAKVAVVASALFASVSGSAVANVTTTGCVTIPMMRKQGYPRAWAGGIEAVASTGGVLTPPIMGGVAFIMAELLGLTYAQVALAAAVPALLYYLSIYLQADFFTVKTRMPRVPRSEIPSLLRTLKQGWFLIGGIFVFIWFVFVLMWNVALACVFATVTLVVLSYCRKETRLGPNRLLNILQRCAVLFAELTPLLVGSGIIVGSIAITGLGNSIALEVGILGERSILLMLLLVAVTAFFLGMGLNSVTCYLILVTVLAPAIVKAGIYPIAGHLFLCWWGLLSAITPPVAISAMVASRLAEESYWKVAFRAMRLGVVAYISPFLIVFRPALVLHGEPLAILQAISIAIMAVLFLSAALEGYMYGMQKLDMVRRLLFAGAALLLFIPNIQLNLIGLGAGAVLVAERLATRRIKRLSAARPPA